MRTLRPSSQRWSALSGQTGDITGMRDLKILQKCFTVQNIYMHMYKPKLWWVHTHFDKLLFVRHGVWLNDKPV